MTDQKLGKDKKNFKGAIVSWPADMPDDMLEDAITVAKKAVSEHDFEANGVEVSTSPQSKRYLVCRLLKS